MLDGSRVVENILNGMEAGIAVSEERSANYNLRSKIEKTLDNMKVDWRTAIEDDNSSGELKRNVTYSSDSFGGIGGNLEIYVGADDDFANIEVEVDGGKVFKEDGVKVDKIANVLNRAFRKAFGE